MDFFFSNLPSIGNHDKFNFTRDVLYNSNKFALIWFFFFTCFLFWSVLTACLNSKWIRIMIVSSEERHFSKFSSNHPCWCIFTFWIYIDLIVIPILHAFFAAWLLIMISLHMYSVVLSIVKYIWGSIYLNFFL